MGYLNTYFDFAENDYDFFMSAYNAGLKGGMLAASGQNICERYLKHIISEYAIPETEQDSFVKESVLKTHSLRRLLNYCSEDMQISIPEETRVALECIDGYYFSTRYPGDDSFLPTERDVDNAAKAIDFARDLCLDFCREMDMDMER